MRTHIAFEQPLHTEQGSAHDSFHNQRFLRSFRVPVRCLALLDAS